MATSCTLPEEKQVTAETASLQDTAIQTADSNAAQQEISPTEPLRLPQPVKNPEGIYQAVLPLQTPVTQTVVFHDDFTYVLQEHYLLDKKDSTVQASGNWTPSDGFIWLYKDQVVRARYRWKGDTLQYYSPVFKKGFSMQPVAEMQEKAADVLVLGTGTEPFWSIEVMTNDSLRFSLPEWEQPKVFFISATQANKDSTIYLAGKETDQLRLTILPFFCSDGMSDLVYPRQVRLQYNGRTFTGCGRVRKP